MIGERDRIQPGQQQAGSIRGSGEALGHPHKFDPADDAGRPQLCCALLQPLTQRGSLSLPNDQFGQR